MTRRLRSIAAVGVAAVWIVGKTVVETARELASTGSPSGDEDRADGSW